MVAQIAPSTNKIHEEDSLAALSHSTKGAMIGTFRRASHHSINKKVSKIEINLSTQTLQSAEVRLKLSKVCTLSKVRLELLVKLFQTTFEIYHIIFLVFLSTEAAT